MCNKGVAFKNQGEKCKIKDGSQEMTAIMLMVIHFNNGCVYYQEPISVTCGTYGLLPPLILKLFTLIFESHALFTACCFCLDYQDTQ